MPDKGLEGHVETSPELRGIRELGRVQVSAPSTDLARPVLQLAEDPELVADFILESREHLDTVETQLLALERDAGDQEAIHAIFRGFHTIKGLAGFLGLDSVQRAAHEVETLLDLARQAQLQITPAVTDVILAATDYLRSWLKHMEGGQSAGPPPASNQPLLERVRACMQPEPREPAAVRREPEPPEPPAARQARETPAAVTPTSSGAMSRSASRSVKVDTEKLDFLVDMVGELVIAQSLVTYDPDLQANNKPKLARNLSQLARITAEVQRTAMAMRMVEIGPLFQKMARLVRDLARKSGKTAQLETRGDHVEVDRQIVEELADPLMHMVRNSIDHGVETPEERAAAGKNPEASIGLRAFHNSGQIVIQVTDDGRGLNRDKILEKARAKGLLGPAANPSDNEVFSLIFHPGFSTAERLSDISGRGVGMDVVRKHIQKLRGSIDIQSAPGRGTTFTLRLPLTLAIIDGLVVGVGGERFLVPIFSVREMVRPKAEAISSVEGRHEMVMVRAGLLPLVRLHERFGINPRSRQPADGVLVVTEARGKEYALLVDEVIGKREVVIKTLGPMFRRTLGIAGGAILGDGQVGLILDTQGLLEGAGSE